MQNSTVNTSYTRKTNTQCLSDKVRSVGKLISYKIDQHLNIGVFLGRHTKQQLLQFNFSYSNIVTKYNFKIH